MLVEKHKLLKMQLTGDNLQLPTTAEVQQFPLQIDITKLRLMMGQKIDTAAQAVRPGTAVDQHVKFDSSHASATDALGNAQGSGTPLAEASMKGHRPLKRFELQLIRGMPMRSSVSEHAQLDLSGKETVRLRFDPGESAALDRALGRGFCPHGEVHPSKIAGHTRRPNENMPMHERYAYEMNRQMLAVRGVVSENKLVLLQDMDEMLGKGWRPPQALFAVQAAMSQQRQGGEQ